MKALDYFTFLHLKCAIKNMSREYQGTFSYNFCLLANFLKLFFSPLLHMGLEWSC